MKNKVTGLVVSGMIGLFLCSCSKIPSIGTKGAGESEQTTKQATPGAPATQTGTQTATAPATGTGAAPAGTTGTSTAPAAGTTGTPVAGQGAAGTPQKNVNVESLPSDMTILTVSGTPVTVGEYRRMFKMQQIQLESLAMNNPQVRANLLQQAAQMKISLSPEERTKLLVAARKTKAPDEAGFKKYLSEHKLSEDQFDKEISDIGVAIKAVSAILQQSLLNDLINRELLCKYGKDLSSKAMNNYIDFKHSPDYQQLADATKLSSDDLRDEIVKNQLSKLMIEKIQGRAAVNDKDLQQIYNKNKEKLQHKERIKLSQIIIAAPSVDAGTIQSVRAQVKKASPKLEGKELDAEVAKVMEAQRQKAAAILTMIKEGEDFAKLANKFSDDMNVKSKKTGGDMGYQEKEQLVPELQKALWSLKAGEVYPGLVQTPLGYLIIKVTERQSPGALSLNELRPQLTQLAMQQKQQQVVNGWLKDKRATTQLVLAPQFASLVQNQNSQASTLTTTSLPH